MDIRITDHGIGIVPDDMSKKILIIEDDRALRETTAAFLEEEGFRVQQPPAGVQGLKAAEKDKPDLSGGSMTAGRRGPNPGNQTFAERSI